jgi:hypothetical protein
VSLGQNITESSVMMEHLKEIHALSKNASEEMGEGMKRLELMHINVYICIYREMYVKT